MFSDLVEAVRAATESAQSGSSRPRVKQGHSWVGNFKMPSVKRAEVKRLKARTRRQGKKAAENY